MSLSTAEAEILWRFLKGSHEAYCAIQPHPTAGTEVLYVYNGVRLIGVVSSDDEELRLRAQQWRLRLVAEGWNEAERRVRTVHVAPTPQKLRARRAGAKG